MNKGWKRSRSHLLILSIPDSLMKLLLLNIETLDSMPARKGNFDEEEKNKMHFVQNLAPLL
tara:strand:- start:393 stop:575 length:183 start_codon:yes stop_codon:yes gene_type:complete